MRKKTKRTNNIKPNKPKLLRKPKLSSTIKKDLFNLPNLLTMGRIIMIPVVLICLQSASPLYCVLATSFFALAAATDYFDGFLARKLNLVSMTGKFLDPLADKLMVMAVTIQLSYMGWLQAWVPIILLARELSVQGLRQIASAEGLIIAANSGGKLKTALQFMGLVGLLIHYVYKVDFLFFETTINFHRAGWWLLVLSIGASLFSAGQYFHGFLKAIDKDPSIS